MSPPLWLLQFAAGNPIAFSANADVSGGWIKCYALDAFQYGQFDAQCGNNNQALLNTYEYTGGACASYMNALKASGNTSFSGYVIKSGATPAISATGTLKAANAGTVSRPLVLV